MPNPYYSGWKREHRFDELRERLNVKIADLYGIHGGPEMKQLRERDMHIINHYKTPNNNIVFDRCSEYLGLPSGGYRNYNINKIKFFKDIPDGIEILIDYVDITAIRTMYIPTEIIYESIYRELPELFEE